MKTRPAYCGAIGITKTFEWLMFFIWQTDTGGCEYGEVYFWQN